MSKRILFILMICLTALCSSQLAYGQAIGSFSGTITDKSGSSIAGASVTVTSQGTGVVRESKTDDTGHYIVNLLPVGVYTIHVQFQGFQPAEVKDLRLQIDEARELDFSLNPASVSSTVEVVADAVAVTTTNPTLGQVITSEQVAQLPLNGRDFVQLATLTPGTTAETNPNSFFNGGPSSEVSARGSFSLSVGGSRANSTDWLLDGNDNNELTAGGIAILSSIDSIQEFKVLTYNYSAEFGTRAGPTVLVTTKSGSNAFHGSLYEFLRNTSLDAKSFFATSPEKFNLNQYGGSLGGAIRKNKTFFFLDGEQKSQRHGITFTGLVPTDAMRGTVPGAPYPDFSHDAFGNTIPLGALVNPNMNGAPANANGAGNLFQCDANGVPIPADLTPGNYGNQGVGFQACNKIPANLFNPISKQMMSFFPEPNANNAQLGFNFVNAPVRKLDETKFDIRLDHNFSASDTAFARFSYDQAVSFVPGGAPGFPDFASQSPFASNQGIQNHGRNISLSETHIFTPTKVNQISGGYNRIFNYITSQGSGSCLSAKLNIPGANLGCADGSTCAGDVISCGLTSTQFDGGYWSLGDRGFAPFTGGTNVYSIADSFDMILGKHDIKMGGSIRAMQMNVRTNGFQDGYWILSGLWTGSPFPNAVSPVADFALGLSSLAIHDQTFLGDTTGRRWKIFRPYVQDDWRATKDLTVNIGLAWDITTPIAEVAGRQADFNPANGQFLIPGVNGVSDSAGVKTYWRAFEPRIGLAYKVGGSDKTVLRAGYAIYHDASWSQGAQGLWQNPPFYAESDRFAFGGKCTFAFAACANQFQKLTPSAISMSDGFQTFSGQPDPTSFTGTLLAQNTNFQPGMVQQFNVNVEHQIPGDVVLTVGYAGSRARHILIDGNNLNIHSPNACGVVTGYTLGCGPGGTFVPQPAAFSNFPFNTINNITDEGNANYNSLQIKAETKNARHGLYALVAYTYSRAYDNGYADGLGSSIGAVYYGLPNWSKLDWALSQINLNQNFTASVIYDLPFGNGKRFGSNWSKPANAILGGWQLTLIEHISSGFPVFVVDSANFSSGVNFQQNGNSLIRPNQVADPNNASGGPGCPTHVHNVQHWFNPCAFAVAPAGQLGNASRTPVNGPDFVNTDFSVVKRFALPWEGKGLDFRAEFFNLFNHAQFGLPNTGATGYADIETPNFGAITSTVNNPRLVQFGLKFTF